MKHPRLLTFRRCPLLTAVCFALMAFVLLPLLVAACTTDVVTGGTATMAAAGLFGAPLVLRDKADEHGGGGGGTVPDPATALAKLEDVTLPMSQRLSVAVQALKGIDPTNQLATIKTQLDEANKTLAARDSEITQLKGDLATASKRITALETDVSEAQAATAAAETRAKAAESKEQDLGKRADAMAKERMRELGFKAADLPPASDNLPSDTPKTEAEMEKRLAECKTQAERSALLRSYKAQKATCSV